MPHLVAVQDLLDVRTMIPLRLGNDSCRLHGAGIQRARSLRCVLQKTSDKIVQPDLLERSA